MSERDLRGFLEILEREGELVAVTESVSIAHELANRMDASERAENKAFLFRTVRGHTIPVAAGLYGSTRRYLIGLRMKSVGEFAACLNAAVEQPIQPELLRDSPALCQEVRLSDDAGLECLPVPTHCPKDAGPYITSGVVALRDEHRMNAGVYRMQVHVGGIEVFINLIVPFHEMAISINDST